jgi:hypothetical protein
MLTATQYQNCATPHAVKRGFALLLTVSLTAHSDECEDGMPPGSTTALMSHTPFLKRLVKICEPGKQQQSAIEASISDPEPVRMHPHTPWRTAQGTKPKSQS